MVDLDHPKDIARFYGNYAKSYHAGAFATPTAKEIAADPDSTHDITEGEHRTVYTFKHQRSNGNRRDFTGLGIPILANRTIVTHVARTPGAPVPEFAPFADYVQTYTEDFELAEGLREQGYSHLGTRVTAAAELITVWQLQPKPSIYPAHDITTVKAVEVPAPPLPEFKAELAALTGWDDDYPLYSDGSWSALSLRGFYSDPTKGVKPAEMDRAWKQAHEDDLLRTCNWTHLASECIDIVDWVLSVPWWEDLERVRLLRMSKGKLGRHTDILDRNGGTRDGQIVRFHTPIITDPAITMSHWDLDGTEQATHLEPGLTYYLDARKPHAVDNPTEVTRVHLVVDVVCSEEVRRHLS